MGCDLHLFIEYKIGNIWCNIGHEFNMPRNYWMFGLLADVRNINNLNRHPKGLPDKISYGTHNDAFIVISKVKSEDTCTIEQAEQWRVEIKDGYAEHPDWHSHSWLTYEEYREILTDYKEAFNESYDFEYDIVLTIMEKIIQRNIETRIVFWFDN